MNLIPGWKTNLAALGLLGLAFFQLSTGDFFGAIQSFFAALAAFGLRSAVAKVEEKVS